MLFFCVVDGGLCFGSLGCVSWFVLGLVFGCWVVYVGLERLSRIAIDQP